MSRWAEVLRPWILLHQRVVGWYAVLQALTGTELRTPRLTMQTPSAATTHSNVSFGSASRETLAAIAEARLWMWGWIAGTTHDTTWIPLRAHRVATIRKRTAEGPACADRWWMFAAWLARSVGDVGSELQALTWCGDSFGHAYGDAIDPGSSAAPGVSPALAFVYSNLRPAAPRRTTAPIPGSSATSSSSSPSSSIRTSESESEDPAVQELRDDISMLESLHPALRDFDLSLRDTHFSILERGLELLALASIDTDGRWERPRQHAYFGKDPTLNPDHPQSAERAAARRALLLSMNLARTSTGGDDGTPRVVTLEPVAKDSERLDETGPRAPHPSGSSPLLPPTPPPSREDSTGDASELTSRARRSLRSELHLRLRLHSLALRTLISAPRTMATAVLPPCLLRGNWPALHGVSFDAVPLHEPTSPATGYTTIEVTRLRAIAQLRQTSLSEIPAFSIETVTMELDHPSTPWDGASTFALVFGWAVRHLASIAHALVRLADLEPSPAECEDVRERTDAFVLSNVSAVATSILRFWKDVVPSALHNLTDEHRFDRWMFTTREIPSNEALRLAYTSFLRKQASLNDSDTSANEAISRGVDSRQDASGGGAPGAEEHREGRSKDTGDEEGMTARAWIRLAGEALWAFGDAPSSNVKAHHKPTPPPPNIPHSEGGR